MLKKINNKIKTFLIALAYGLKNTEEDILRQKSNAGSASNSSEQKMQANQLAEDLLKGEATEEVSMLRDRTYLVSDESKKYRVIIDTVGTSKAFKNMTKINVPKVYNDKDGFDVSIIMDNEAIPSGIIDGLNAVGGYGIENIYPLKFTYQYNPPKFKLDEYVSKLVIRSGESLLLDLYVPIYIDSFERLEKLFDNEINKIKKYRVKPTNISFETVGFLSNKTYGVNDLCNFSFKMINLVGITEYDGKNILTYEVEALTENGLKITDKYKNKKLRENYANNAPRNQMLDLTDKKSEKHKCDKCGGEMESEYDYRITKSSIGIGVCKNCLSKYNEKNIK